MFNQSLLSTNRKGLSLGLLLTLGLALGITMLPAGRARAQVYTPYGYGYGPYYGGYGYGYGYPFATGSAAYNMVTRRGAFAYGLSSPGPFLAAPIRIWGGLTPAGSAALTQQTLALNASRYNLMNSQAAMNYQAANMYNQMALRTMLENYGQAKYGADSGGGRYPITGPAPRVSPGAEAEGADPVAAQTRPIFGEDGRVLWPESTPVGPELDEKRLAASEAIQAVAQKSQRDGRAPVSAVVDAKEKLEAFGRDAIQKLQEQGESEAAENLSSYIQNIDYTLTNFVNTTPRMESNVQDPTDSPKTGGDVLKESIRRERPDNNNGSSSQQPQTTPGQEPEPQPQPESKP